MRTYLPILMVKAFPKRPERGLLDRRAPMTILTNECAVDDCSKPRRKAGGGRSRFCSSHQDKRYRQRDRSPLEPVHDAMIHRDMLAPIGYDAAHGRVRYFRGKASQYTCVCGAKARDWAYVGGSGYEQHVPNESCHGGMAWVSPAVEDYTPLCKSCHKRLDNKARRVRATGEDAELRALLTEVMGL